MEDGGRELAEEWLLSLARLMADQKGYEIERVRIAEGEAEDREEDKAP